MYALPEPAATWTDPEYGTIPVGFSGAQMQAAHAVGRASRDAEIAYANEVIEQRNAEIKRGHEDFIQAVTDPENQPSQFGTVTLAMHEAAQKEAEALRADRDQLQRDFTYIKQRRDALLTALEKLARLGNGDRYGNSEGNAIAIAALNGEK